ncbi:helix-turn-helix domain-containing protein [Streptomyces longispororuber]|uniref:helix-turn-helix domain-containing protein n=1 Tax=Streptomyces longispororuber TaxID=68230 RepID=UPI0036F5D662
MRRRGASEPGAGGAGPAAAPPACLPLAAALRELRERTGLSLEALGRRTAYSRSSWERYLNGKQPVPRKAVLALCALAEEPPGRLLALWELADAAWSGRSARGDTRAVGAPGTGARTPDTAGPSADDPATDLGPVPPGPAAGPDEVGTRHRWTTAALGAAAVVVAVGGVTAGLALTGGDGGRDQVRTGSTAGPYEPRCTGAACEGEQPQRMGCGGPGQVVSLVTRGYAPARRVELRLGKACEAVWARATGLLPGDRVVLTLPGAKAKEVRAENAGDTRRYLATRMTALKGRDPGAARVCVTLAGSPAEKCFSV